MIHGRTLVFSAFLFSFLFFPLTVFAECPPPPKANWAGQMVWVKGDIHAALPSQPNRVLARRSPVYETDTITTGADGGGQIVFSDESIVALRASTTVKIENYAYNKDAKSAANQKYVLNLIEGGFRAVTGLVAKQNPSGYAIKTPVATIGVRGTVFSVLYNIATGVLKTGVWAGSIIVANEGGTLTLTPDARQFAEVVSKVTMPKPSTNMPILQTNEPALQSSAGFPAAIPPQGGGTTCTVNIGVK